MWWGGGERAGSGEDVFLRATPRLDLAVSPLCSLCPARRGVQSRHQRKPGGSQTCGQEAVIFKTMGSHGGRLQISSPNIWTWAMVKKIGWDSP